MRDLYFAARTKYSDSWARVEEHIIAAEQEIMSSNRIAPIMNPVIINFTGDDSDSEFGGDDQVVSIQTISLYNKTTDKFPHGQLRCEQCILNLSLCQVWENMCVLYFATIIVVNCLNCFQIMRCFTYGYRILISVTNTLELSILTQVQSADNSNNIYLHRVNNTSTLANFVLSRD